MIEHELDKLASDIEYMPDEDFLKLFDKLWHLRDSAQKEKFKTIGNFIDFVLDEIRQNQN